MALAMQSNLSSGQDADLMDIDIDMDIDDNGPTIDEEFDLEDGEEPSFQPTGVPVASDSNLIPAIYTEDPALEPIWEKIHIRGVDDFHTTDILAFAHDYFPDTDAHVQWIDDTSANIVFKDKNIAREAMLNFTAQPTTSQAIIDAPFELRVAKPLASRPRSMLTVRVAQVGDRKKKGARDASRYYLLHPEEDPTERMRREFANGRTSRGGENGEYRRRKFDDREHRRRRDNDHNAAGGEDFAASMYDDAPASGPEVGGNSRGRDLSSRITKGRRRSASPGLGGARNADEIDISDSEDDERPRRRRNGYRDRTDLFPTRANAGKELFANESTNTRRQQSSTGTGTLHSDKLDLFPSSGTTTPRPPSTFASGDSRANVVKAQRLKADLLSAAQTSPRAANHRRSHAMDAKNEEDLAQRFARKSISIDSTKSGGYMGGNGNGNAGVELFPTSNSASGGLSIKGSASNGNGQGLSIKGRAEVKELFPERYKRGGNEGKELFDEPIREKRARRRAGDLFD